MPRDKLHFKEELKLQYFILHTNFNQLLLFSVAGYAIMQFTRWTTKIRGKLYKGARRKNVAGLHGQVCTRPQHGIRGSPQAPAAFASFQIRVGAIGGRWTRKKGSLSQVLQHLQHASRPKYTHALLVHFHCVGFTQGDAKFRKYPIECQ